MRLVTDAATEEEATEAEVLYKEKRRLALDADIDLRNLEAELAGVGVPVGDEIDQTIGYLKDLDRLLEDMPADCLRDVFDAVGARLEVRFAPNPSKGRRRRIPVGGTLAFEVGVDGRKLSVNTESSAIAEGSGTRNTGFGCGGWI